MEFVYALRDSHTDCFKVGRAKDIGKRRKSLQTGRAAPLELFCKLETDWASTCEKYIHDRLENEPESTRVIAGAGTEFFAVAPETIHRVFAEASEFVTDLKEAQAQIQEFVEVEPSTDLVPADEGYREVAEKLRDVRKKMALLEWEQQHLESQLKIAISTHEGIEGIATWKSQLGRRFQQTEFKTKHPDLYESFSVEKRTRVFRLSKELRK